MSFCFDLSKYTEVKFKNKRTKFCLWTHVQNESQLILGMLESAYRYIDYWVLVDNGSTDGTQDLIINFFKDKNIPGKLFQNPNGWISHGVNRQWAWERLSEVNHGCDWILRVDADEGLKISDDFDWSIFDLDRNVDVCCMLPKCYHNSFIVARPWIYKWGLNWSWTDHKAHELPSVDGVVITSNTNYRMNDDIGYGFMHITRGRGNSWNNPIKYLKDTINLEKQVVEQFHGQFPGVPKQSLQEMNYYLYYIGMSYFYHTSHIDNPSETSVFVFGRDGAIEHNRRGVNHWTMYLKHFPDKYLSYYFRGNLYYRLNEFELSCADYIKCYEANSKRNESLIEAVDIYNRNLNRPDLAFNWLTKTIDNECVIKYNDSDFVQTDLYIDTGIRYFEYWYETAKNCNDVNVTKFVIDVMNRGLKYDGYHFVDKKLRETTIRNYINELSKLC